MKKRILAALLVTALCLAVIMPAMAANVFLFTEKSLTMWEGETAQTQLRREGVYEGDGEITYVSGRPDIATVANDGTVTAVHKGSTTITATLTRNGKRAGKTQLTVKVLRAVNRVTLGTTNLSVYEPNDPVVAGLLREPSEHRVLVLGAGSSVALTAVCTPEDANNTQVVFDTSDAGVARILNGRTLRGVQRGECDLTLASKQNPEVTETFRVLVTQPVKKVQIEAEARAVEVGDSIPLSADCIPADASIREVVWSSKNPQIATVDADGNVTGVKKGTVTIIATAADGSKAAGSVNINVTQPVTSLQISQGDIPVIAGRSVQAKVTVLPADASDKGVQWSSSDDNIATVVNGKITGRKAGTCTVTCSSRSNPGVTATAQVTVSQLVTKIEFTNPKEELSIRVGERVQLSWQVLPEDATNQDVTFKSAHPKVATVDGNGVVTAVGRGTASIYATAADASRKQGGVRVNVIQPVTGVNMQRPLYYIQLGGGGNVRAVVEPRNANNQKVYWSSVDDSIATIRSNGTSTGHVQGYRIGRTTITAYTEDGGFTASADVRVGNFNAAVMVEDLEVNANNQIKIVLRNMSEDLVLENIYCRIECYDLAGNPMICNKDGTSTFFEGFYPFELQPRERTAHGSFRFQNYEINQPIGAVVLTVTGWRDAEGVSWTIPESERLPRQWVRMTPIVY